MSKTSNIDTLLNRAAVQLADPFASIKVGTALADEIHAAIARRAAKLVRYCPECGTVGEVAQGAVNCCPDGARAVRLPPVIAEQAALGLALMVGAPGKTDEAIIRTVLPACYALLNDFIETAGEHIPKARVIEARKLLPPQYSQSITKGKAK